VRYPHAIWQGANEQDFSRARIRARFVVVHVEQGTEAGTDAWFHNPSARVSAHFGVAKTGLVQQFVDTDFEAYAEMAYNGVGISIEHEGYSGQHLTADQMNADVKLLTWINATTRIPLIWRLDGLGAPGVVGHGELGLAGGDHLDCPGTPIKNDIRNLLNRLQRPSWRLRV
jgi:hypothetical protein